MRKRHAIDRLSLIKTLMNFDIEVNDWRFFRLSSEIKVVLYKRDLQWSLSKLKLLRLKDLYFIICWNYLKSTVWMSLKNSLKTTIIRTHIVFNNLLKTQYSVFYNNARFKKFQENIIIQSQSFRSHVYLWAFQILVQFDSFHLIELNFTNDNKFNNFKCMCFHIMIDSNLLLRALSHINNASSKFTKLN